MAFVHGKGVYVSLGGNNLSSYCNTSVPERTADTHDVTTYGKNSHVFAGGLLNGSGTIGGFYDSSTTSGPRAIIEPLLGTNTTYIDCPEGNLVGKPRRTVSAIVSKYTETRPVADMITWSADLQFSDDVAVVNATSTV
jgi:hypothetical protein